MGLSTWGIRAITEPKVLRAELLAAIKNCDGNRSATAVELGLPHRTFYNLLEKLGIERVAMAPKPSAKKAGKVAKVPTKKKARK